jgi:hypothetical protein
MTEQTNGNATQEKPAPKPEFLSPDLEEKFDDLQRDVWHLESELDELTSIVNGWEEHLHRQEYRLDQLDIRLAQLQKNESSPN